MTGCCWCLSLHGSIFDPRPLITSLTFRSDRSQFKGFEMLEGLPIELIGHILRALAELSIVHDPATVMKIALVGSIGYTAAIPVLYRTLDVKGSNYDAIVRIFDESQPPAAADGSSGLLQLPPSVRICPHIRRVFVKGWTEFPYLQLLPNLEMVFTVSNNRHIFLQEDFPRISKSLTLYASLSSVHPHTLPQTITHASFYIPIRNASEFQDHAKDMLHDTITHLAIELNDHVFDRAALHLRELLNFLLCRPTTKIVVLRLYRAAVFAESVAVVIQAIRSLEPVNLQERILIWMDQRQMESSNIDIATSLHDAMKGRTPWTEGIAVEHARIEECGGRTYV